MTRAGREDRRRLEATEARFETVSTEQGRRQEWLAEHADTLAYRDQLSDAVTERRHELGLTAAITQPDHLVRLIGPVPLENLEAIRLWTRMASRIEAYREEWVVPPERLQERPVDACQEHAWAAAVHSAQLLARVTAPAMERRFDHGLELGW